MMHTDNIHLKDDLLPPEIRETMRARHCERPAHELTQNEANNAHSDGSYTSLPFTPVKTVHVVCKHAEPMKPAPYDIKLEPAPILPDWAIFTICFLAAFSLGMIIFR